MRRDPLAWRLSRRAVLRAAAGAGLTLLWPACRNDAGGGSATSAASPAPSATATATPSAPIAVTAVSGYDDPQVWADRTLVVSSWGGDYEDAQRQAIFEPFERLTGAKIETDATDVRELRTQVENGETQWDVSDVLAEDVLPLANAGVLQELDFNIVELDNIFSDLKTDYSVPSSYYSTVMAYNTETWPNGSGPQSWADFWDTTRFAGYRGLHRDPQTTLEFALLADGMDMNQLYPLDVDRAFTSLDKLRDAVTLWWEQGAQPAQTLNSGGVAMVSAWHSRLLKVQGEGGTVGIVWNGGALSGDCWVLPKGSKNRDVAMDFVNFATRPETTAAFASLAPFGPANQKAFDYLAPDIIATLPTSPALRAKQFSINLEWWFKHRDTVAQRFEDWLSEHP